MFGKFCSREMWRPKRTVVPAKKLNICVHNWIRRRLELQYSDIGLVFVGYLCKLLNFCYVLPSLQPSVLIRILLINLLNVHAYSGSRLLSYCLETPCIAWGYLLFGQATTGFFLYRDLWFQVSSKETLRYYVVFLLHLLYSQNFGIIGLKPKCVC